MSKPTIGVTMIVKNEEAMLPRCLETVKKADAIYIADTGSTDSTVKIAKKYTDKIFTDYKWEDSFCKARNLVLSRASTEFILVIDADEMLVTPMSKVREIVDKADKEGYDFVSIKVTAEGRSSTMHFPRIHKNIPEIKWYGAAHNYLANSTGKKKELVTDEIEIVYGYSPAHRKDPKKTMRILRKALKEDPTLSREKFYLAREYWYKKDYKNAIKWVDKYLKKPGFRGEIAEAFMLKARALWATQKGEEARIACMFAIFTNPDFKEALIFMSNANYEPRKSQWKRYADLAENNEVLFVRNV